MIIMAGILDRHAQRAIRSSATSIPATPTSWARGIMLAIVGGVRLVIAGPVLMTVAQRRIPIQQAKHTRGPPRLRRAAFLPPAPHQPRRRHAGRLRLSLMIFPSVIFSRPG
jgi:preprotein translocase subunit SecY